jgi:hypothetical protein
MVRKTLTLVIIAGSLSCASNSPPQSSLAASDDAVVCTRCQAVWVREPSYGHRGRLLRYQWALRDTCPDCKDAVASFFATGRFQHTCKTCGDTLQICKAHQQ